MGNCVNSNISPEDIYKNCTYKNTPYHGLINTKRKVKILRIVSFDIIDVAVQHTIEEQSVKLSLSETPPNSNKSNEPISSNLDCEKSLKNVLNIFKYRVKLYGISYSNASIYRLSDHLLKNNNVVTCFFYKPDNYGRLTCTLYGKNGEDINASIIKNK